MHSLYFSFTPLVHLIIVSQLSLLSYTGWEMSLVMLHGWGVNTKWLIPYVDKRGWQVKLHDPH